MSTHATPPSAPTPPTTLFRTIKLLTHTPTTSTYLCLPRHISPPPSTQLIAVTTSSLPSTLRHHHAALDALGQKIFKCQFTSEPGSSWICHAPFVGASFAELGTACGDGGGLAGYVLAHVFVGVLDGVACLHAEGMRLGGEEGEGEGVKAGNVLLVGEGSMREEEEEGRHRWRGWPEVVLTGLGGVQEVDEIGEGVKKDAKAVLQLMARGIGEWSDSVAFFRAAEKDGVMETTDEMLLVLRDVQEMLKTEGEGGIGLEEVRDKVYDRLLDIRQAGPQRLPREITEIVEKEMVTGGEMRAAAREPTVLAFNSRHEAFVRIIADEPVEMGGGHAGMRTVRILVMRFTARKRVFSRMCGVEPEGKGSSADGEFEVDEDYVIEDAQ